MNFILALKAENRALARELAAVKDGLNALRGHLHSAKFAHGDRLDGYINTGDVLHWIRGAEQAGIVARETEIA